MTSGPMYCITRYRISGAYPSSEILRNAGNLSLYKDTARLSSVPMPSVFARIAEAKPAAVLGRSPGSLASAVITNRDIRLGTLRFLRSDRLRRFSTVHPHQFVKVAAESSLAREHTVCNDSQTIDVRARVRLFAANLFRRHVERRADYWTDPG